MQTITFHWFCRFCRNKCIEAIANIDLLENQTRNLAVNLTKLTERVAAIEGNVTKEVTTNVRSQLNERSEIDRRKNNVMVMNLPEPVVEKQANGKEVSSTWYTKIKKDKDV